MQPKRCRGMRRSSRVVHAGALWTKQHTLRCWGDTLSLGAALFPHGQCHTKEASPVHPQVSLFRLRLIRTEPDHGNFPNMGCTMAVVQQGEEREGKREAPVGIAHTVFVQV